MLGDRFVSGVENGRSLLKTRALSARTAAMSRSRYEVVIVGAGIAGASLAYFLSRRGVGDVLVLEREANLAYHSTGRSAASLSTLDAHPTLFALKLLAAPFFTAPPEGFSPHPLLKPSGVMQLFGDAGWKVLERHAQALRDAGLRFDLLSPAAARARVTALDGGFAGAAWIPGDGRLDVHEILQSYLRHARAAGAELRLATEVTSFATTAGRLSGIALREGGEVEAGLIVDAAGAWAGEIARLAGASAIPIVPHRRTLFTFGGPSGVDFREWPLVASEPHSIYFTPEAGELMLSPMDEEPIEPCDPTPDDRVIAAAIERLGQLAPTLVPRAIHRRWSGLRSFSSDRAHVVGEDPRCPGFFWLAGQGGCGIETSPAVGRIAADLIVDGRTALFDAGRIAPGRFAATAAG
jgi:D-arginine dehydrogenase